MYINLKIYSKNKISLNKFLDFIKKLKFPIKTVKTVSKFSKKKFLTVLKSPHVNKSAQEQFEFRIYSKQLSIWSPQSNLLMLILKKAIKTSFPGIKIKIDFLSINENKFILNSLNPKNLNVCFFNTRIKNRIKLNKKINCYLVLNDCYGELCFI